MSLVTKEIFLNANVCMTLGWFLRQQGPISIPSEADQFRMQQGVEIGMAAHSFFPDGRFAPPGEADDAAELLADSTSLVIFEATFQIGGYIARPDILKRNGSGWDVIEVKSNLEDSDRMDELVDDLTYTVMVLERCGLAVAGASLMLISRGYRMGMPTSKLLVNVDQTAAMKERLKDFRPLWKPVHDGTASAIRPKPMLIAACKSCDFFPDRCIGTGVSHPVHSIPSLHKSKLAQLAVSGILEVEHIPANFPLTRLQQRMVDCVRSKQPFISKSLRRRLGQIQWPANYLDFESMMTAVPLFAQVSPFEQIVTQYSIHRCSAPGLVIGHHEYLADCDRDCQQELAERLLADLGTEGSIIVYSSFEATRIGALADRFPDLAGKLEAIKTRLFDLLKVIRRGFYHHQFGGSYSIKRALPVLVPEMSYDGLEIGDGETASARFAKMVLERYSADEAKQVRADLLGYCKQDTLAMVRLHERLLAAKS